MNNEKLQRERDQLVWREISLRCVINQAIGFVGAMPTTESQRTSLLALLRDGLVKPDYCDCGEVLNQDGECENCLEAADKAFKEFKGEYDNRVEVVKDGESGCQECGTPLNNCVSFHESGLCVKCFLDKKLSI